MIYQQTKRIDGEKKPAFEDHSMCVWETTHNHPFFYGSCDFFKNQFRWLEYWYGERVLDIC